VAAGTQEENPLKKIAVLARWALGFGVLALGLATLVGSGGGGGEDDPPPDPANQAPAIVVQPESGAILDGDAATFNVVASGTSPLSYSWRRNGTAIDGAAASRYTTPALAMTDSGASYTVVVSNSAGSVTSAAATVTVNPVPPSVSQPPLAVAVVAGQAAQFSVAASGSAPLTYQWLRNGAVLAGASSASYTTPVLALADNGARYSARVSNGGGSVTSAEALLTVTATAVAPSIATHPLSVTASAGQTATFSVLAAGTAPLAYQWRRDGADILGAVTATYTTPALAAVDNAAVYSVRVSNSAGAVVSNGATLTVQASSSPLIGRAWAAGQQLESGDTPVTARLEGIDDLGRVTTVFTKTEATREVLYATRGLPGAAGVAPTWTTPVAIDEVAGLTGSAANTQDFRLDVAPNGHAAVLFTRRAPCTTATYDARAGFTCSYRYVSRYLADGAGWEPPVLMADAPGSITDFRLRINELGDVAVAGVGWVRSGTNFYSSRFGTWRRARSAASFAAQNLAELTLDADTIQLGLDRNGSMLLVAEASQSATTDIVAYRGDMASGFGAQAVLDQRGNAANLVASAVGRNGHQAVVWTQNNGTSSRYFAATSETSGGAWQVNDLAPMVTTLDKRVLVVSDAGKVTFHDLYRRKFWQAAAGVWTVELSLPADAAIPDSRWDCGVARTGDYLCNSTGTSGSGLWTTFDAARNVIVKRATSVVPADYVLGVSALNRDAGFSYPLLAPNGIGFVSMANGYDVLPSPVLPAGDRRSVRNLWGAFLK